MAQINVLARAFSVQESELIFYYPKIVKAVGHDDKLFPFKKIKDAANAKLSTHNLDPRVLNAQWQAPGNPLFQKQLEEAARSLLHPPKKAVRTPQDAQRVLQGFVKWMDNTKYTYVASDSFTLVAETGGMSDAKLEKLSYHFNTSSTPADRFEVIYGNMYNVFASVKSPMGNCGMVANAFALLLFLNGFPKDTIELCFIAAGGGTSGAGIFFKGEANPKLLYVSPSPKGLVAPTCELSSGGQANVQCKQLYPKDADRPFDNHWIVKCNGLYYDPLYRCSYGHPDDAFDRIERVTGADVQCHSPAPVVGKWVKGDVWRVPADGRWILKFESPTIWQVLGISQTTKYMLYKPDVGEDNVSLGDAPEGPTLTRGLGRAFGHCLPASKQAMRDLLMVAVLEYERGLGFFRRPSKESIDFCKVARAFCDNLTNVPRAIFDPSKETGWKNYKVWTEQSARGSIINAVYHPKIVGETLRKCLWKAFGVPSWFRA